MQFYNPENRLYYAYLAGFILIIVMNTTRTTDIFLAVLDPFLLFLTWYFWLKISLFNRLPGRFLS